MVFTTNLNYRPFMQCIIIVANSMHHSITLKVAILINRELIKNTTLWLIIIRKVGRVKCRASKNKTGRFSIFGSSSL